MCRASLRPAYESSRGSEPRPASDKIGILSKSFRPGHFPLCRTAAAVRHTAARSLLNHRHQQYLSILLCHHSSGGLVSSHHEWRGRGEEQQQKGDCECEWAQVSGDCSSIAACVMGNAVPRHHLSFPFHRKSIVGNFDEDVEGYPGHDSACLGTQVPCKENQTISWLQEDVSRRYERHQKCARPPHPPLILPGARPFNLGLPRAPQAIGESRHAAHPSPRRSKDSSTQHISSPHPSPCDLTLTSSLADTSAGCRATRWLLPKSGGPMGLCSTPRTASPTP